MNPRHPIVDALYAVGRNVLEAAVDGALDEIQANVQRVDETITRARAKATVKHRRRSREPQAPEVVHPVDVEVIDARGRRM